MRVFLMMMDNPSYCLTENLYFDRYQKLSIVIKSRYSTFYDYTVRIHSKHIISLRRDDSFLELVSNDDSDLLGWSRHSSDDVQSSWTFSTTDDGFIDSGTAFYLRESNG